MTWLLWALIITMCSTAYQLSAKMLAGTMPVFFITAVTGMVVMLGSCIMLNRQAFTLSQIHFTPKTTVLVLLIALAAFGIEIGFNQMYRAGAPLSLARMITTGGVGLILVAAGVLIFHEKLSIYQMAGIFLTIAGLVMLSMKSS